MGLFSRICFSFHILAYCRNLLSDSGLKQVSFIGLFSNIWVSFDIFGVLQEAIERLQVGVGLFSHMWVSIHVYRSLFTYVAYCRKPLSDSRLELVSLIGLFCNIRVSFHVCGSVFYIFGVLQQAIERLRIGVGLFYRSIFPYMGLFSHIWHNAGSD